ncbi:MAG: thioesterase family protein [Rhodospirillales bacterium]
MNNAAKEEKIDLTKREAYPFWSTDTIRFQDIDRNNHVNNIAFAIYCETGRTNFIEQLFKEFGDKMDFVVARMTVDYLAQAYFPGSVEIGTAIKSLGTKSCGLVHAVFCNGACIATGETIWVYFNRQENRSEPLPDDVRALLEKYCLKGG